MKAPNYKPIDVANARSRADHTQEQAGEVVYRTRRGWQEWELGNREIDPAVFELYLIKTGQME